MFSIRAKIIILTVAAILVSIASIAVIGIISIKSMGDQDSAETMRLICDNRLSSINAYLESIKQSVETVSRFSMDELDATQLVKAGAIGATGGLDGFHPVVTDPVLQRELDTYLEAYSNKIEALFRSVANHTNGGITFYFRINPEISTAVSGFLYSKIGKAAYTKEELTPLENYDSADIEHVGWYYIPIERGRPSWLDPYYNDNLGINMLSYAIPLYQSGSFIGVIGMDISYETLVSQIEHIHVLDTGYAFLLMPDGTVVYHPYLDIGVNLGELLPEMKESIQLMKQANSNSSPILYERNREQMQMFFGTLSSGLKLVVTAPVSEINQKWMIDTPT